MRTCGTVPPSRAAGAPSGRLPPAATPVRPPARRKTEQERDEQSDKEDLRDEDAQSAKEQNEQEEDEQRGNHGSTPSCSYFIHHRMARAMGMAVTCDENACR